MPVLEFENNTVDKAIKRLTKEAVNYSVGTVLSCKIDREPNENFLEQQSLYPKFYWRSRDKKQRYLCWGISAHYRSLDQIDLHNVLPTFAAFAFDKNQQQWTGFPAQQIWQPLWCVVLTDTDATLIHVVSSNQTLETSSQYNLSEATHLPSKEVWSSTITELKNGPLVEQLAKVVMSRQSCVSTQNLWQLFKQITIEQTECYHFLYTPNPGTAFMGCSPERLFSISNGHIFTEAIAGTRPRGFEPGEDDHLDKELRNSDKDNIEHNIVTTYIENVLQQYSSKITIDPRRILRLKNVQHLQTPIRAQLHNHFSMDDLLRDLHPTPAVCGYPKSLALDKIRSLEPFTRGWYSGTIGILHEGYIDFTVTIRSALVTKNGLFIWTGAGIVADSNPTEEWKELNVKGKQFFDLVDMAEQ